jgi:signal transduction histidine kinase
MKRIAAYRLKLFVLFCISTVTVTAQQNLTDSLTRLIIDYRKQTGYEKKVDYINLLNELSFRYVNIKPDTSIVIANEVIQLAEVIDNCNIKTDAQKNIGLAYNTKNEYARALMQLATAMQTGKACNYTKGVSRIYHNTGIIYSNIGNYPLALENYLSALKIREEMKDTLGLASTINAIGAVYFVQGKYDEALKNYLNALELAKAIRSFSGIESGYANIGESFFRKGTFSEARKNILEALQLNKITGSLEIRAFCSFILASIFLKENNLEEAADAFLKTRHYGLELGNREYEIRGNLGLSETLLLQNKPVEALQLADEALAKSKLIGHNELTRNANELLSRIYEKMGKNKEALYHQKQFKYYADSINNLQTEQRTLNLAADYEYSKKELEIRNEFRQKNSRQNWIIFSAFAALFSALVVAFLVFRSRQKEKKSNLLLHRKNVEIDKQKTILEKTLTDLQATQQQLIQSEKMASLGELTAGIAHEIQNPLNFVNNFSEVSSELLQEMNEEIDKGNYDNAKNLGRDVKSNLEKILHHGNRADSIVKGMLQHSRTSSGEKELTDINALCDEYLRLAFHGLRAKDKSFNAKFETKLDENVGKINVVPLEIGRVLLNMINNAFYAVTEKKKTGAEDYQPTVTVTTTKTGNKIEIRVLDNGTGISQKVIDKIFQPFFTTKPTGQGTGLGLSLAYDTITKGHGGELLVESKEGKGTEFIIILPV